MHITAHKQQQYRIYTATVPNTHRNGTEYTPHQHPILTATVLNTNGNSTESIPQQYRAGGRNRILVGQIN